MQEGFLVKTGFFVPIMLLRTKLGLPSYNAMLKKLTLIQYQKVGPPKKAVMYKECILDGVHCIYLPRTLIQALRKIITINIILSNVISAILPLKINLYDNQNILINYLNDKVFTVDRIAAGTATCILNLRAGMGKTFVASGIISKLGMRTLYIVPKRPLALQAVKDLRACFYDAEGIDENPVIGLYEKLIKKGRVVNKKKPLDKSRIVANHNITVIVINSAMMLGPEFFAGYSCIVLDEVHMYCSEKRREIFRKCSALTVLGMSATTEDRNDGFDPIAHKELAFDGIIRAEAVPNFTYEDVLFDCTARIINYSGGPEHTKNLTHESTGRVFTHYMHNQFIADPNRLIVAVDELIKLYDWRGLNADGKPTQHSIYVFAEEVDILRQARVAFTDALRKRQRNDIADDIELPEDGTEMFTGGMKDDKVSEIILKGRVLFSSYGYASTGISILKMSAIMFLTPRKSTMKQTIARILRRGSDTTIPRIVVDIVDTKTALRYQVGERKLAYYFYGFKLEETKIKFTDITV